MKIAMIGQKGIPAKSGGVEKHVEEIATRLVSLGHEVTVYCRNTYMDTQLKEIKGVKLKTVKTVNNKNLDAIVYTFRATVDALKSNYDIFHYHALGPASLSFIPKLFRKKVVVTVHGLDWQRDKWSKIGKLYLKFGEYITGKCATKIISVSENLREYFIKKYARKEEDVLFIPNGVNVYPPVEADLIKELSLEKDEYILFLARLVPEKGAHYLIEAYKGLNTDIKLVIAGGESFTDNYVNKLKKLAKGNENIIFTGNVQGKLKAELYSNCYLYVLPSDIEGMPLTLLEAMSFGKNCLVSNIPENEKLLKGYGHIFKKGDVEDLKEKLIHAMEVNKIKNFHGEIIIDYVKSGFGWQGIVGLCEDTYKSI